MRPRLLPEQGRHHRQRVLLQHPLQRCRCARVRQEHAARGVRGARPRHALAVAGEGREQLQQLGQRQQPRLRCQLSASVPCSQGRPAVLGQG